MHTLRQPTTSSFPEARARVQGPGSLSSAWSRLAPSCLLGEGPPEHLPRAPEQASQGTLGSESAGSALKLGSIRRGGAVTYDCFPPLCLCLLLHDFLLLSRYQELGLFCFPAEQTKTLPRLPAATGLISVPSASGSELPVTLWARAAVGVGPGRARPARLPLAARLQAVWPALYTGFAPRKLCGRASPSSGPL